MSSDSAHPAAAASKPPAKAKKKRTASRQTPPPSAGRDYVGIADAFAQDAVADTEGKRHGRRFRQAASRYLKDRKRATQPECPFYFDGDIAHNFCDFIEKLPHVEGTWKDADGNDAPYIIMHPAHVFFCVNLFGFRNQDGNRRFTSALLNTARKNAKSTLAACILLACQAMEDEPGAQIISAATTGQQARAIFNPAKRMVEMTPDLQEAFDMEAYANAIVNWQAGSNFRPINSKASTQDGLNPSHTALDEIHAHKTADLLNVLKSAAGARLNPLWLYLTTEGYETPGPWPELRHFAHQVLDGIVEADHLLVCIFAVDAQIGEPGQENYQPGDDDFDESKWPKANPLMEVNPILLRELRKLAIEAKQMPSTHAEFRIKRLNRQAAGANTWVDLERWKRCNGPVDLTMLEGKECWGGLDGAATTDIMAFRLVWRIEGIVYTYGWRWVPVDAVNQRTERQTVPYAGWVERGYIEQLPGNIIDYEAVEAQITAICHRFTPKNIGYDPWNIRDLTNRLKAAGIPMEEFRQGPKSYHPAMQETERLYRAANLRHGGDPVLAWCVSNVVARRDENLNMAPDKKRSPDKIDDACALFMAVGTMGVPVPEPAKFQLLFV